MTNFTEVYAALESAIAAHAREPELLNKIRKLQDDLDLANYELDERMKEISQLQEKNKLLYDDRERIREERDEAHTTIRSFEIDRDESARTIRSQGWKIEEQSTDLSAKQTMIDLLNADKAELSRQLSEANTIGTKLKAKLARIFGEVADEVSTASEVALSATFPVDENNPEPKSIPLDSTLPLVGESVQDQSLAKTNSNFNSWIY